MDKLCPPTSSSDTATPFTTARPSAGFFVEESMATTDFAYRERTVLVFEGAVQRAAIIERLRQFGIEF